MHYKPHSPFVFTLPDGHKFFVYQHELLWIIDGDEFLGSVAFRYKSDSELEDICCGHVGIAISEHARGKGYATEAMYLALDQFRMRGFSSVHYTVDPQNLPSVRLIEKIGGVRIGHFDAPFGCGATDFYKIALA